MGGVTSSFAQTKQVSGVVVGKDDGLPVAGAAVLVKGTRTGATADADGKFTISAKPKDVLVFSFLGMVTQEVPVEGRSQIEVLMETEGQLLDQVVVVAYGTATKQSITGAVAAIDSKKIEKTIGTSVTGALEGAAPGVQVNNTYGEPGSDPNIRIRGFSTINGSNAPLYVVDGVPYSGNISDLNSADIESLSVLKDASSAALYGNRAANGVVIITTKRAKEVGKPIVTASVKQGIYNRGIKDYDRLGAKDWMEVQWTGLKNYRMSLSGVNDAPDAAAAYATEHLIGDLVKRNIYNQPDDQLFDSNGKLTAQRLPGYNDLKWADALERNGYRQDYGLSYAVNGRNFNVFASLGYLNEEGYIINTNFERYSGRVNAEFTPTKWFKGGVNIAATSQKSNYNSSANGTYYANPFYGSRYKAPVYPIYEHNEDGSIVLDEFGNKVFDTKSDYLSNRHVVYERLNDIQEINRLTAYVTAYATFILPYGFEATVKATRNYKSYKETKFDNPEIGDGAGSNGRYKSEDYHYTTTTLQEQITWDHDYGQHHIDALLAHESYQHKYDYTSGMNSKMAVAGNIVLGNFTEVGNFSGGKDKDATESFLARARYNYGKRYYFDASYRRDGTSRFHEDNRWGDFFSVGAAWDITGEKFMQKVDWMDYLKLRASFGEVGNNYNSYYAYQALYNLDKNGGDGALAKKSLPANDLKWETTQTIDVGLESTMFGRFNFNAGYFNKRSKDLIFAVPLPLSAGSYIWSSGTNLSQLKNIGSLVNYGWEFSADVDAIRTKDWKWNIGVDATLMKNKVKKLPDGEDIPNGSRRYSEGHSIYEFYTYQFVGVDQMTGNSLYELDTELTTLDSGREAGKMVTINGTEYTTDVNFGRKDWSGTALPTVYGSVHTDLSWKGISLNVLFTYSLGGKIYDSSYRTLMTTSASSGSAQHVDILKSWNGVPAGMTETSANRIDPNGIPIIDHNLSSYNNGMSTRWLTSASYLVLKNITLSYSFPSKLMSKWGLQGLAVSAGIENAFTLTARQGMNPQYSFTGSQDDTYTTARIFNLGVTLKF